MWTGGPIIGPKTGDPRLSPGGMARTGPEDVKTCLK